MTLRSYQKMEVKLISSPPHLTQILDLARAITMKQNLDGPLIPMLSKDYKFILDAEHTSILEHVNFTFLINGVSRSFLAQITRHRIGSFTSGSQHYQDYSSYPAMVHGAVFMNGEVRMKAQAAIDIAYNSYTSLISLGLPKEEARQVLPNAAAVNLLWTVNLRSLINFLRLRLCKRNVAEMCIFAERVWSICNTLLPDLFIHVGPQCFMDGVCKQGKMNCGGKYERNN